MDGKALLEAYLNKPTSITQTVTFGGSADTRSCSIYGKDVAVVPSSGRHTSGSSKMKIKNIVDYGWEHKYYIGRLLAVHMSGVYIAYSLRAATRAAGPATGIVRVVNRKTGERALLKGMQGLVVDLAFAHISNQVVLAVVDEPGNLFVYQIQEGSGSMTCTQILQIDSEDQHFTENHRVIWCPYIPDEATDEEEETATEDVTKLLVLTHDEKAETWNVDTVIRCYGPGPLSPSNVESGYLKIFDHKKPIIDAAFSPDGTALATASVDGDVKFFQVYMHNENNPRCLHAWQPHGGQPLSCVFFLDNHKKYNPENQFWKFAVTGADNNKELKIWSCESWTCLQTIRFKPEGSNRSCCLKAGLDLSAGYLLLSDVYNRLLYILQIQQDSEGAAGNQAFISSITEFLLHYPMLSFGIVDAGKRKFRYNSLDQNLDDQEKDVVTEDEDDGEDMECDVMRLYFIQPKSLQECHIVYQSANSEQRHSMGSVTTLSQDSLMFREGFSDVSMNLSSLSDMDTSVTDPPANHSSIIQTPVASQMSQQPASQISLLTPEDFSSPATIIGSLTQITPLAQDINSSVCAPKGTSILETSISSSPTLTPSSVPLPPTSSDEILALSSPRKENKTPDASINHEEPLATSEPHSSSRGLREGNVSGGSSPSREVQEILAEKTAEDEKNGYYEVEDMGEENDTISEKERPSTNTKPITSNIPSPPIPPVNMSPINSAPLASFSTSLPPIQLPTILTRSSHDSSFESAPAGASGTPQEAKSLLDVMKEYRDPSPQSTRVVSEPAVWPLIPPDLAGEAHKSITEETARKSCNMRHLIDVDNGGLNGEDVKPSVAVLQPEPEIESSPQSSKMEVLASADEASSEDCHNFNQWSHKMEETVTTLLHNMNSLMQLQKAQQTEIKELHSEIKKLQLAAASSPPQSSRIEESIISKTEKALHKHNQQQTKRIEEILRGRDGQEKQRQEMLMSALCQTVTNTITTRLDNTLNSEFKNNVVPALTRSLDPLKQQVENELAHKLTATDHLLRDNISKMIQSKSVLDMMGQSAASALQSTIQDTYKESFNSTVLPYFEKACQNMFTQINDSFGKGTKEYVLTLENYLEKNRRQQEKSREPLVNQLQNIQGVAENLQTVTDQLTTSLKGDFENHVEKILTGVHEKLEKRIQEVIQEEIGKGLREQQSALEGSVMTAVRSRAVTPSSHLVDPQLQQAALQQLIASGQFNAAFQQALTMENLSLVMFVCERVSPKQMFGQNSCPLQQPVLLSLIQQLSSDLNSHTELKQEYLEGAITILDTSNRQILEHIPAVINRLRKQLQIYIAANPNSKIIRNMKILLMATHSVTPGQS